jgi:hypothetical protein
MRPPQGIAPADNTLLIVLAFRFFDSTNQRKNSFRSARQISESLRSMKKVFQQLLFGHAAHSASSA